MMARKTKGRDKRKAADEAKLNEGLRHLEEQRNRARRAWAWTRGYLQGFEDASRLALEDEDAPAN